MPPKKKLPPFLQKKIDGTTDGRGKAPSAGKNTPSTGTPADQRKAGRGNKPGPTPGTAAARKGSAKGGRTSKRG